MAEPTDYAIVEAMRTYGGSFAKALAEAFHTADARNLARLKDAFPDVWVDYTNVARHLQEQGRGPA